MFERAEVRRGGRAVSFPLAALARGVLLVAALVLLRGQPDVEPPVIIVDPQRWRDPAKPIGPKADSTRDQTHKKRHRPRTRPTEIKDIAPPPGPEPEIQPEPEAQPSSDSGRPGSDEGQAGIAGPGPGGATDCVGSGCPTHRDSAPPGVL